MYKKLTEDQPVFGNLIV